MLQWVTLKWTGYEGQQTNIQSTCSGENTQSKRNSTQTRETISLFKVWLRFITISFKFFSIYIKFLNLYPSLSSFEHFLSFFEFVQSPTSQTLSNDPVIFLDRLKLKPLNKNILFYQQLGGRLTCISFLHSPLAVQVISFLGDQFWFSILSI